MTAVTIGQQITGDTPWRELGDCSVAELQSEFRRQTGPQGQVSPLIGSAAVILAAAGGHGRLLAAMSWVEQKHGTFPSIARTPDNHNFLSLSSGWSGGGHTWHAYASFAACAAAWLANMDSPTGPYRNARTLRELVHIYAPPSENNSDRYVDQVVTIANRILRSTAAAAASDRPTRPAPSATVDGKAVDVELVFGNVIAPAVDRRDIDGRLNTAWDFLGPRQALFVVLHRMYGTLWGTDGYFRGEARTRGRTDYGVDNTTGEIVRWTDPLGTLSPWASGPYQRPSGDGPALVAKLGKTAINRDGISVEVAGADVAVSAIAWDRVARLIAFWADWNRIPYTTWPINPRTGVTFLYWHREFNGGKGPDPAQRDPGEPWCPGGVIERYTTHLIEDVRTILKEAQTRGATGSTKPTVDQLPVYEEKPPSAIALPDGVTPVMVADWFGSVTLTGERSGVYAFDPNGPMSKLYLERGNRTGSWPQLESVTPTASGLIFRYRDGWTVLCPAGGSPRPLSA